MRTNIIGISVAAVLLSMVGTTWAQYYVEQGRVLDANRRLGSGGLNTPGRTYDIGATNRLMSGNVTGGRSFQGFSPIRDSNSLFISRSLGSPGTSLLGVPSDATYSWTYGLPSSQLSGFQRDSLSVGEVRLGQGLIGRPRPFYAQSSTVTNVGAIAAGLNRPGTSQLRSSYEIPSADLRVQPSGPILPDRSARSGGLLSLQPQLMRVNTGETITGQVNPRLLTSPLFGNVQPISLNAVAARAERDAALGANVGGPLDQRLGDEGPLDTRVNLATPPEDLRGPMRSPLDQVLGGSPSGPWTADEGLSSVFATPEADLRGMGVGSSMPLAKAPDVYAGMRVASGSLRRPLTGEGPAAPSPTEAGSASVPPEEPMALADRMAAEPLTTFVGTAESAVNKHLAEAETLLKSGQYYKAAAQYDLARVADPKNPLPLVGRAMALLAAGDYMTSANSLFQAIDLFEALGQFRIDLEAFIPPDLGVLDRRRAYLENRLELYEDFRLRFLLGFAEYCSGIEGGLSNLEKAAEAAPQERASVRRFVQMLEHRGKVVSGSSSTRPAGNESPK